MKESFFATILVGGNIGDIYRYQNGRLHYYTQDHESTLTDTGLCELPGTRIPDSPIPYPALNELKRIYTSKAEPPNLKVICFMLPHETQKDILPFAGAIPGTYFHSQDLHASKRALASVTYLWEHGDGYTV